jgi:mycofactocin glycosyltransferase
MPNRIFSEPPVPTQIKNLWSGVEEGRLTHEEFAAREQALVADYISVWSDALCLPGESDLTGSICRELADLTGCHDLVEVRRRCRSAVRAMKEDWEKNVHGGDEKSIEAYYDQSDHYAYELMWWHTLEEDRSPLAYVCALHLALQNRCEAFMDFGAGTGSGALLFVRHGVAATLADISSKLLDFSQRRLAARNVPATYIDLKTGTPPPNAFDFIAAMDVFEHIAEPEKTATMLANSLRPGGILFGRFSAEDDPDRPSHIARDFEPMFKSLADLGFSEIWRDEWLWGHQAFQKAAV